MEKFNRDIDENKLAFSKERTIIKVMDKIENKKTKSSIFGFVSLKLVVSVFTVLVIFTVFLAIVSEKPYSPTPLSQVKVEKLVETSYMSASVISTALVDSTTQLLSFIPLADDETEFEKDISNFNYYFNMLKVFIDQDSFMDNATVETLTDSDYDYQISYQVDGKDYLLLMKYNEDNTIVGIISIGEKSFIIEGSFEDKEDDFELELVAKKDDEFIKIEYSSENENEIERVYEIEQNIGGVYSKKEVKIEYSDDEVIVEIEEGENEYSLEKYSENGVTIYFLKYEVNNSEGEVLISEMIDEFGDTYYNYHIDEDGLEKDIDLDDPDEKDKDDEDKDDKDKDKDKDKDDVGEDEDDKDDEEEEDEDEKDMFLLVDMDLFINI